MTNLGQSLFALGALSIMGTLGLNANKTIIAENTRINSGESGITAVGLAQSLVEEAMGKYFDAKIDTAITGEITLTSQLTPVDQLGPGPNENYRAGTNDFNDFDDFNNLFLVYKSSNPSDTASTSGSDWETIVPSLEAKYFVKTKVTYISVNVSNIPQANSASSVPTWHKKLTVTVINPTSRDTLVYPAIMSYWR